MHIVFYINYSSKLFWSLNILDFYEGVSKLCGNAIMSVQNYNWKRYKLLYYFVYLHVTAGNIYDVPWNHEIHD